MNKTVILGTNNHLDYIMYYPYVVSAWNGLGWNTIVFHINNNKQYKLNETDNNKVVEIQEEKYSDITIAQVARLFGHKYISDNNHMIMTSDIDMMPLSNYWNPEDDKINCYGYDLTKRVHYPICYIAATKRIWEELIPENSITELLDKYPYAKSRDFDDYWYTDQHIITERIKKFPHLIKEIDRTFNSFNLAYGRIDRALWGPTYNSQETKIDCHMPRPFNKLVANTLLEKYHQ